jgi:hypothetical protein
MAAKATTKVGQTMKDMELTLNKIQIEAIKAATKEEIKEDTKVTETMVEEQIIT